MKILNHIVEDFIPIMSLMPGAAGGIKRLVMELGGNDPMIVLADADIEAAARFAVVFGKQEARKVVDRLEAGMVGINQGAGAGDAPWVGAKESGFGFHGTHDGHRQFAQVRVLGY